MNYMIETSVNTAKLRVYSLDLLAYQFEHRRVIGVSYMQDVFDMDVIPEDASIEARAAWDIHRQAHVPIIAGTIWFPKNLSRGSFRMMGIWIVGFFGTDSSYQIRVQNCIGSNQKEISLQTLVRKYDEVGPAGVHHRNLIHFFSKKNASSVRFQELGWARAMVPPGR